jgi:hypothetical protein
MHKQLKAIGVLFLAGILLTGCAGKKPNPIMVRQYGDERKSCIALEREIAFIEEEINRLMPKTQKTGKNVALGITGAFFIVPLFFMDFSEAEQMEIDAYRQRYNHLVILAEEKECGFEKEQIPEFQQPVE